MKLFVALGWAAAAFALLAGIYWQGKAAGAKAANAHWQAEISRLNAEAAQKTIAQRAAALKAENEAQIKATILTDELARMEVENEKADNSGADCGIGLGRVRLLNRQAAP